MYWDIYERRKIDNIRYFDPERAIASYKNYFKKYPKDYEGMFIYASMLITLQRFDLAYEVMETANFLYKHNRNIKVNSETKRRVEKSEMIAKLRYLSYTGQYDELFDMFIEYRLLHDPEYSILVFYCKNKLGMIDEKDISNIKNYRKSQEVNYSEDEFIKRVERHLYDYNQELDDSLKSNKIFAEGFPIEKIIEEVRAKLDKDKRLLFGFVSDTYIFKYDSCGYIDGKIQDYFKVVCIHDTDDIITIYPSENCEKLPHVDLNYLNDNNKNYENKRPSQIEKFNRKMKKYNECCN